MFVLSATADTLTMMNYSIYSLLFFVLYGGEENEKRNNYGAVVYLLIYTVSAMVLHTISTWFTVCMAAQRYIQLTRGTRQNIIYKVHLTIVSVVILSGIVNAPQSLVYSIRSHNDTQTNATWYYLTNDNDLVFNHILVNTVQYCMIAILIKIIPSVSLTVLSILLIRFIRKANTRYLAIRQQNTTPSNSASEHRRQRQTQQATSVLLIILVVFVLIELPQGILYILSGLLKHFFEKIYWPLGNILDFLTIIRCCVNFVLHCVMSSQFCAVLKKFVKRIDA